MAAFLHLPLILTVCLPRLGKCQLFIAIKLESLHGRKDGPDALAGIVLCSTRKYFSREENPGSQKRVPNDNLPLVLGRKVCILVW